MKTEQAAEQAAEQIQKWVEDKESIPKQLRKCLMCESKNVINLAFFIPTKKVNEEICAPSGKHRCLFYSLCSECTDLDINLIESKLVNNFKGLV